MTTPPAGVLTAEQINEAALSGDPAVRAEAQARLYEEMATRLASTPTDAWNLTGTDVIGILSALHQAAEWQLRRVPAPAQQAERDMAARSVWGSAKDSMSNKEPK